MESMLYSTDVMASFASVHVSTRNCQQDNRSVAVVSLDPSQNFGVTIPNSRMVPFVSVHVAAANSTLVHDALYH